MVNNEFNFRFWCFNALPQVYDDSLSYYELLNKTIGYINHMITDIANMGNNVVELYNAFKSLEEFTNKTFSDILNDFADSIQNGELVQAVLDRIDVNKIKADVMSEINEFTTMQTQVVLQYINELEQKYEKRLTDFINNKESEINNAIEIAKTVADQILGINNDIASINSNINKMKADLIELINHNNNQIQARVDTVEGNLDDLSKKLPETNVKKQVVIVRNMIARPNTVLNNFLTAAEINDLLGVSDSDGTNTTIYANIVNRREIEYQSYGVIFTFNEADPDTNSLGYWTTILNTPPDKETVLKLEISITYWKNEPVYVSLPSGPNYYEQGSVSESSAKGSTWDACKSKTNQTRIVTKELLKIPAIGTPVIVNPDPNKYNLFLLYFDSSQAYTRQYEGWIVDKYKNLQEYYYVGVAVKKLDNTAISPDDVDF